LRLNTSPIRTWVYYDMWLYDLDFNQSVASFDQSVNALAMQWDGKIIVGGQFTTYNWTTVNRIVRLNSNGTIDTNFAIWSWFNNSVNALAIQWDGKIIVGGQFTTYSWTAVNYIARLNTNGTLDASFNIWWWFSSSVYSLVVLGDGKILVGGNFSAYNGTNVNRIVRLNSDWTRDTSFTIWWWFTTTTYSFVNALAVQGDGKVVVGWHFTHYSW
jgi:uncharacterized delta-60 repeat protein